ncbi:MAG: response regulator [Verrucomicrobia bacterium]|nr:response regulator [Verrucomicrobiota bacterium]
MTLPTQPPSTSVPVTPPPKRRTLLVVDDDEGPRESLRMIFSQDYQVITADAGPHALVLAQTRQVDVAILDLRMPGMSGLELFAKLREQDPTIEVIILTAYESVENVRQALRLGACDYLSKPYEVETIRAAVAGALERHDQLARLRSLEREVRQQQLAEAIVRTKSEIYASVLHDINAPLSSISCLADIIIQSFGSAEKLEGENLEQIKENLLNVIHHANHCVEISRRYVSFLRRERSVAQVIKVNEILGDVARLLKFHPDVRNQRLSIQPLAGELLASANGIDLIQILVNLIINGLRCSPVARPVIVSAQIMDAPPALAESAPEVARLFFKSARFSNTPPVIALAVQDFGPGIAPPLLARLFEPKSDAPPAADGGGLGLVIVQRCIEASAAALGVESRIGQGTTFTVYLSSDGESGRV